MGKLASVDGSSNCDSLDDVVGVEEQGDSIEEVDGEGEDESPPAADPAGRPSVATLLVNLAKERYSFGVTPDGDAYALPAQGGHVVSMIRESWSSLRAELSHAFFMTYGKVPSSSALTDALLVLEGVATQQEPVELHLRTAGHDDDIYLDIGDSANHVVRIGHDGWSITTSDVPVLFSHTADRSLPPPGTRRKLTTSGAC